MATNLCVFGPFDVPYEYIRNVKRIESKHKAEFWSATGLTHLRKKHGCYVFALRAAKGFVPWYVGRAAKGFQQESFTTDKRDKYNNALTRRRKGTPVLFFVAPPDGKNKVPSPELSHMEKELIQFAIRKNPHVRNVQNTKNVPRWTIKGVIRSSKGTPPKAAKQFKTMLRI